MTKSKDTHQVQKTYRKNFTYFNGLVRENIHLVINNGMNTQALEMFDSVLAIVIISPAKYYQPVVGCHVHLEKTK